MFHVTRSDFFADMDNLAIAASKELIPGIDKQAQQAKALVNMTKRRVMLEAYKAKLQSQKEVCIKELKNGLSELKEDLVKHLIANIGDSLSQINVKLQEPLHQPKGSWDVEPDAVYYYQKSPLAVVKFWEERWSLNVAKSLQ